jgi:AraC family transcriptional regulator
VATQLAVHLVRNYASVTFREANGKGRLSPAQVRRLTGYIDNRLHEQLHLETLAAVAAITREAEHHALGSALYVEAAATQLTVHLLRKYASVTFREPSGKGKLSPAQVRRLTAHINDRLHEQLHLQALAAVVGLGIWTFARHFRESFGRTPHAYIVERRIDRARRLLAQSSLPIKEIASLCGFADQAHMTRIFQTHLHTTPAALRL